MKGKSILCLYGRGYAWLGDWEIKVLWSFRRKMQRSKRRKAELKQPALVPENRQIRKICPVPALTGFALCLSFSLVFRIRAPSYKPRCLVYKAAKASTDKNNTILMATLYYAAFLGLIDEYMYVCRKAKPIKAIALKSGLRVIGSNTELHCAYKQKGGAFLERKTNTLCYPSRQMILQERFSELGISSSVCNIRCLFSDPNRMAVYHSNLPKEDVSQA